MKVFEEMLFQEQVHVNIEASLYVNLATHKNRLGESAHMTFLIQ